ncbi:chorismate-binding protein [Pseudoalteromonas sp. NBT06-2]|uniref:chromate efflux transporter n=1 Tax=Pseudoalteromonas sp. NBT06-2 TaxID=2025950 RepID=UPI000BA5CBEB|nr:chromate efflux transporter [Pseudoalteromonas sp. NBT06-2]PAJ74426.1 chorismate-binding protein [Pseudoalteromonas sp. NBT06-2]
MFEIFYKFFILGCMSFGGPAAHIGYFRQAFVEKNKWLSDKDYGQLVALSQFLPGPGSSQVGFSIGYHRAGLSGAIAAFLGFTLPSVIVMLAIALMSQRFSDNTFFEGVVHGLKLLAVIVVADAVWGMFNNFCKQKTSVLLCTFTAIALLLMPSLYTQMLVLIFAALVGKYYLSATDEISLVPRTKIQLSWPPLIIFISLLISLPLFSHLNVQIKLFSDFFQAGSLVFGGGHVVLPLLEGLVGEQLSQDSFLTAYATAQAVPGPMFTLATFLGFELLPSSPVLGALLATLAVFLPGFLLILIVLKNWQALASNPSISGAMNGVNAAVVGLLLSALYQPVFQSAVINSIDMALVILGIYLLKSLKLPILLLVALYSFFGILFLY